MVVCLARNNFARLRSPPETDGRSVVRHRTGTDDDLWNAAFLLGILLATPEMVLTIPATTVVRSSCCIHDSRTRLCDSYAKLLVNVTHLTCCDIRLAAGIYECLLDITQTCWWPKQSCLREELGYEGRACHVCNAVYSSKHAIDTPIVILPAIRDYCWRLRFDRLIAEKIHE
jgi:hypothetical protein